MAGLVAGVPERRVHHRVSPARGSATALARLRTGPSLRVINVSPDGMLVESPVRLLPGRHVDVVLQADGSQEHSPWLVVHSRVGCLRGLSYLRYHVGMRRMAGSHYPGHKSNPATG
jgi:hypothetical protein